MITTCKNCFEKQKKIDNLKEEIKRLKAKLQYEENKVKEGYFGSSTPSSQKPFKENIIKERKNRGLKKGHKGYGRKNFSFEELNEINELKLNKDLCPDCGEKLQNKGYVNRNIQDIEPIKVKKKKYICEKKYCPNCKKILMRKPKVLPNFLYGNELIAQAIVMYYEQHMTLGKLNSFFGIKHGNFCNVFHNIAHLLKPVLPKLIEEYLKEISKHADESKWRTYGLGGYIWAFLTKNISLFKITNTRAAVIPLDIFGESNIGYLTVDRYAGYNRVPCKIQYCYAHLLRSVKDLAKECDNEEVQKFAKNFGSLLSDAMHLNSSNISDIKYYLKAKQIKNKILKIVHSSAKHPGIQNIQFIFKKNKNRLYHWVDNRKIPPDNNLAERDIRTAVIARKISFCSQSTKGAETRSILMSILQTAKKRLKTESLVKWLKKVLDEIVKNPNVEVYSLLPPVPN